MKTKYYFYLWIMEEDEHTRLYHPAIQEKIFMNLTVNEMHLFHLLLIEACLPNKGIGRTAQVPGNVFTVNPEIRKAWADKLKVKTNTTYVLLNALINNGIVLGFYKYYFMLHPKYFFKGSESERIKAIKFLEESIFSV